MTTASSFVSSVDFSPVRLAYAAALRGVQPRKTGTPFTYAWAFCEDAEMLICLAASNPDGHFYGLLSTLGAAAAAQNKADRRGVENVSFLVGTLDDFLQAADGSVLALPPLDYLFCDGNATLLDVAERTKLFDLAAQKVKPSGLFVYRYRAYADVGSILRGLVKELSPEMTVAQAKEFLRELKNLNPAFFENAPDMRVPLDEAIAHDVPDSFFAKLSGNAALGSLDVMDALLGKAFAFVADAAIGANYQELVTPPSAHAVLMNCREHPFYEAVKDFAMGRLVRNDIWCRMPVAFSDDPGALFGSFAFGTMMPRELVPPAVTAFDRIVPLSSPLYAKIIDLMATQPLSIGDFLAHPLGQGESQQAVLEAFQILVATGVARPMRTGFVCAGPIDMARPRLSTTFNQYVGSEPITTAQVLLASPIVGNPVTISARDALVLQALERGGLEKLMDSLAPELARLASNPAMVAAVMDGVDMTADGVKDMVKTVVETQMARWYAYGFLAA